MPLFRAHPCGTEGLLAMGRAVLPTSLLAACRQSLPNPAVPGKELTLWLAFCSQRSFCFKGLAEIMSQTDLLNAEGKPARISSDRADRDGAPARAERGSTGALAPAPAALGVWWGAVSSTPSPGPPVVPAIPH